MHNNMIDLTQLLNENSTVYPDTIGPKFEQLNTIEVHGFAEMKVTMVLHSGTHIDAPCHILSNAKTLSDFPIEKFMGAAMVISCQDKAAIELEYLETFEQEIAQVDFILFFTGWQNKWNSEAYFENCPVLTEEAAKWLTTF